MNDLGQLLFIGIDDERWSTALNKRLSALRPGGVYLSPRVCRTPQSAAGLVAKICGALDAPPLFALQEEGCTVDPLRTFFPPLPSTLTAARRGPAAAAKLGELIGAGFALLGFNTVFAPRLDLATAALTDEANAKTFGFDSLEVARCGEGFVRGLRRAQVLPCAKYFPGRGNARLERDADLWVSGKPMAEMWREDLVPYRKLLRQLPAVMVSHHAYKAYDFDIARPAIHSANVLEGLLRVKLRYRGVALSGDVEPEFARRQFDAADAAVQSIAAGCDMVIVGGCGDSAESYHDALQRGLESGRLSAGRVAQALERILLAKKGLAIPNGRTSLRALNRLAQKFEEFSKDLRAEEQKSA